MLCASDCSAARSITAHTTALLARAALRTRCSERYSARRLASAVAHASAGGGPRRSPAPTDCTQGGRVQAPPQSSRQELAVASRDVGASTSLSSASVDDQEPDSGELQPEQRVSPLWAIGSALGVAFLLGGGYALRDEVRGFLEFFIQAIDHWGPWGYAAYAGVYVALEVLALPAIPLTMTAGVIFGTLQGTLITAACGTAAATIAFLIARHLVRGKVQQFARKHPKWQAIDRAIGKPGNGLKFVTLLRLSPLLPLSASNYLYGCTSVDLGSYVLGTLIGMTPGSFLYVQAGALGRQVLMEGQGHLPVEAWQVGVGLATTVLALAFVGQLAKGAIEEADGQPQHGSGDAMD